MVSSLAHLLNGLGFVWGGGLSNILGECLSLPQAQAWLCPCLHFQYLCFGMLAMLIPHCRDLTDYSVAQQTDTPTMSTAIFVTQVTEYRFCY